MHTHTESSASVVQVHGKDFEKFIPAERIGRRVREMAADMQRDLAELNPVFIPVLNGAFFFAADLLREVNFAYEISFVKIRSYTGMTSSGEVQTVMGLEKNLTMRHVVIVEDIVDTGRTMNELQSELKETGAASVRIAALICKPTAMQYPVDITYKGFDVPDAFLVGYGLDYDNEGRNFRDIYKLKD
jgi:hypoxanthine phosphoribosyltransferase